MISFSIGDKVKVTILQQGSEGTIVGIHDRFYVVEFLDRYGDPYTYAYEKHELIRTDSYLKCECGAAYVVVEGFHSTWCPKYKIEQKLGKW